MSASNNGKTPATVALLAAHKGLAAEWLVGHFGLRDATRGGVIIPYPRLDGTPARSQVRPFVETSHPSFWSDDKRGGITIYASASAIAQGQKSGFVVVCEGSSDVWALTWHEFPALGIPGATMCKHVEAEHLRGIPKAFVVREPGKAGKSFVENFVRRTGELGLTIEVYVLDVQAVCGVKDPADLHVRDPKTFTSNLTQAMEKAERIQLADAPDDPEWGDTYPWPKPMRQEAFHGIAGEFVRTVAPHTEADPHALLANFLSGVSAMIGSSPHTLGVRRQPAKVNNLIVGDTGDARKGTAFEDAERFLRMADGETLDAILAPGITSGEGLIRFLRTPVYTNDETGTETPRLKRAWGREGEYTRLSAVARREGSTLSQCLRDAFDNTTLANLTKRDPDRVHGAHIAISADVTKVDLIQDTPDAKFANGVVNRFALICARRERLLPRGGTLSEADLAPAAKRLNAALRAARDRRGVPLSDAALIRWDSFYGAYETQKLPPLLYAATRRGSQYVLRIALIHGLLDEAAEISLAHLEAAIAFWEYAFASAQHIFAARLGYPKADDLLKHLRDIYPNKLTGAQVDEFFGKHLRTNERQLIREELLRLEVVTVEKLQTGERGRPSELWQAKLRVPPNAIEGAEKYGLNDNVQ